MRTEIYPLRLLGKSLLLFLLINIMYAAVEPPVHRLSAYNTIFPGRIRFPFGDGSDPYIVAVDDLDVMAASHAIAAPRERDEFRVVIIGDSTVWGDGLPVHESISVQWAQLDNQCNGSKLEFYNLGYPHPSVLKDLMILEKAMEYEPDMIVWFVTLNTLAPLRLNPFLLANSERAERIIETYGIPFSYEKELRASDQSFYQRTLVGERSELARALKLQALGFVWSAIGMDMGPSAEVFPADVSSDVKNDDRYKDLIPGADLESVLLLNTLNAGHAMAAPLPILIVNQPIYIATGRNSEVRYNDAYPRWAYDQYRNVMALETQKNNWNYLDLWDAVPVEYFADARFHISAQGEELIVQQIDPILKTIACQ